MLATHIDDFIQTNVFPFVSVSQKKQKTTKRNLCAAFSFAAKFKKISRLIMLSCYLMHIIQTGRWVIIALCSSPHPQGPMQEQWSPCHWLACWFNTSAGLQFSMSTVRSVLCERVSVAALWLRGKVKMFLIQIILSVCVKLDSVCATPRASELLSGLIKTINTPTRISYFFFKQLLIKKSALI